MRVGESIRKISFWFIDFLKGGTIYGHYNDIKFIIENPDNTRSKKKTTSYLQNILQHASSTTSFYHAYEHMDIKDFPIINKEIIKSSYSEFESTTYKHKKRISVTTSGSTGAAFTIFQDLNKKARNIADIIYYSELTSFSIGYRLYYLRFWNMFRKKSKVISLLQNIVSINVFDLSSGSIKKLIDDLIKDRSNKGMIGYASSFSKICKYLDSIEAGRINCKLQSAIGISERLEINTKIGMKKYFGVDMVSRYSNSENGMIAQQPMGAEYFNINWASYYVEIFDILSDEPVEHGVLGRIVVTDLFNYVTPIIRYDTGDLGSVNYMNEKDKSSIVLAKVEGRKMDMIRNTSGDILSTSILLLINKYDKIIHRQIIQKTKKEYLFKLKTENDTFDQKEIFIQEFKEYLGQDAIILIELVTDISLLPSGKERAIINEVNY